LEIKILLVAGSFPPMRCGVGDYSYGLAKALSAMPGVKVGVLTSAYQFERGGNIEVFPVVNKWSLFEIHKIIRVILRWSPDIVHIQFPTQGYGNGWLPWVMPAVSVLMKKKVVQTWHEGFSRRSAPGLFLISIFRSALIVVRSHYEDLLHPMLRWALWWGKPYFIPNASTIPEIELGNQQKDALRKRYLNNRKRLIVFFGFVSPQKGIELIFDIANPVSDQIVIAGEISTHPGYYREIVTRASAEPWAGRVTISGFLPPDEVAALLTVADAVILPFRLGGGEWNTSLHAAVSQRVFVLTTSLTQNGYDEKQNVYYAKVDDVQEMKMALGIYAGNRRTSTAGDHKNGWPHISQEHRNLYEAILPG
jgi:glycosyltransferase involved in cell wall biosynthesis